MGMFKNEQQKINEQDREHLLNLQRAALQVSAGKLGDEPNHREHISAHIEASKALKLDTGKLPWDLMSVPAIEEMLKVLQFGSQKYTAHNWRLGFKWTRLISAAARHLFAFLGGEDRDPETGLLHTAHLMCCAMFLTEHVLRNLGSDDRYKEPANDKSIPVPADVD